MMIISLTKPRIYKCESSLEFAIVSAKHQKNNPHDNAKARCCWEYHEKVVRDIGHFRLYFCVIWWYAIIWVENTFKNSLAFYKWQKSDAQIYSKTNQLVPSPQLQTAGLKLSNKSRTRPHHRKRG